MNKLEFQSEIMCIYVNEAYRYTFAEFLVTPSLADLQEAAYHMLEVVKLQQHRFVISDLRLVGKYLLNQADWIHKNILHPMKQQPIRKYALIVNDPFLHEAEMSHLVGFDIQCFTSYQEAETWILTIGR